jgi:hypothetical protein
VGHQHTPSDGPARSQDEIDRAIVDTAIKVKAFGFSFREALWEVSLIDVFKLLDAQDRRDAQQFMRLRAAIQWPGEEFGKLIAEMETPFSERLPS